MKKFDYEQDFKTIDFRQHPELYPVGRGEQGVLMVEPYKSEILPHWRFRTVPIAKASAAELMELFEGYRARRYSNNKGGRKYDADGNELPRGFDEEKAAAAAIFKGYWDRLREDEDYLARKQAHQKRYG
ncbi:DUF4385 domain-containing protein [Candidatus Pantoea persica]|uniref:DUF4385 domain-containing protein n=1 Tax=Candidatus Pantoea persica TaxID=2518128 RepID=UPI00215DB22E|nr:DUF4385 domain-containing protein [Candidatus Pantoea persica]MBA2815026.1 cytoplasmic protein [Candidatus Pantoea persica]